RVVVAPANLLATIELGDEAVDHREVPSERIAFGVRDLRSDRAEPAQRLEHRADGAIAIETVATPRAGEVALLDEPPRRVAKGPPRALSIATALAATKNAANAFARIGERALEPAIEDLVEEPLGFV